MCLHSIEYKNDKPVDEDWKTGWKCFIINPTTKKLESPCFKSKTKIEVGKILTSSDNIDMVWCNGRYTSYIAGFHIWDNQKDAIYDKRHLEIVRKVRYRKVTARGTNDCGHGIYDCYYAPCIVALEMIVEEDEYEN